MRISLRWKILLLAVLTPATLGLATLVTVDRNVRAHVNSSSIHENLEHSVAVFESMLRTRSRALLGGAHVIARDPRFFSLLMLGSGQRDSRFVATVRGMARDFNEITQTDLFEVLDRRGHLLASVGTVSSSLSARDSLVRLALRGRTIETILVDRGAHYQVALAPVISDHTTVGVLILGAQIGPSLARELRAQMHCDVTFLSGSAVTGTTLNTDGDRAALLQTLGTLDLGPGADLRQIGVQQVRGPNETYLTLVRRIPVSDPRTRQLYVLQRAYDPETTFLHTMKQDMVTLGVVALILALLTGLLFSEQVLRPIGRLVRASQAMEQGDYDHPLAVRRSDELGYLAERFVVMRQRERTTMDSLEQAARLKSQFLSIASHELRTPLSVLIGYRDLLANGELGPVTPKQQQALQAMESYLARLTSVAEDAARFARVKGERLQLDVRPCDPEAVVQRAVAAARAAGSRRQVAISIESADFGAPVDADPDAIEQAILQLVSNGIRYTPDGGRVVVRSSERDGRWCIAVEDSGVGISEERLGTLLLHGLPIEDINNHRSATGLEFNAPGLGLGLSIARGIAEAHRGTLSAESRVGKGSTFVITVPMRHTDERATAA